MPDMRSILVLAQPGTAASPAMQRARALALRHKASIHLCAVAYNGAIEALRLLRGSPTRRLVDDQMNQRRLQLEQQAEGLRAQGIPATCSVLWGSPVHEVAAVVIAQMAPDLVIHDVGEVPALRIAAMTPTDWNLLRLCPAPLMLVKSPPRGAGHVGPVIAAVDTSNEHDKPAALNDAIVVAASNLSADLGVELHVAEAFQDLTQYLHESPMKEVGVGLHREQMARHKDAFEAFASRRQIPPERRHFMVGYSVERCMTDLVHHLNAELVVLGAIHRTGLDRLLIGSTAERMLSQLTCDVLLLKPAGFLDDFQRYVSSGDVAYLKQTT